MWVLGSARTASHCFSSRTHGIPHMASLANVRVYGIGSHTAHGPSHAVYITHMCVCGGGGHPRQLLCGTQGAPCQPHTCRSCRAAAHARRYRRRRTRGTGARSTSRLLRQVVSSCPWRCVRGAAARGIRSPQQGRGDRVARLQRPRLQRLQQRDLPWRRRIGCAGRCLALLLQVRQALHGVWRRRPGRPPRRARRCRGCRRRQLDGRGRAVRAHHSLPHTTAAPAAASSRAAAGLVL